MKEQGFKRMKKLLILILALMVVFFTAACDKTEEESETTNETESTEETEQIPEGLVEMSGTVKEVNDGLVLIETADSGEFMLRFSENSKWDEGINKEIAAGNTVRCLVKPEPTFTTPSQGEVIKMTANEPAA